MKESEETSMDEAKETPKEQKKEEKEGTEEHIIPEEFQHKVHSLVDEYADSKLCLSFMSDCVYEAKNALERKEMESRNKGKKNKVPESYSTVGMPD